MIVAKRENQRTDWFGLFSTATTFVLFNMLWLFSALLIVTIPAVTAALFASVAPWSRGESINRPLADFWQAIKKFWWRATAVFLIDLLISAFILFNLLIITQMGPGQLMTTMSLSVNVFFATALIVANVYIWPLLVTQDLPLTQLLKRGLRLTIIHPAWGVLIAVGAAIPVIVSIFLPGMFLLTVAFTASALIVQWGAWRVIRGTVEADQ